MQPREFLGGRSLPPDFDRRRRRDREADHEQRRVGHQAGAGALALDAGTAQIGDVARHQRDHARRQEREDATGERGGRAEDHGLSLVIAARRS